MNIATSLNSKYMRYTYVMLTSLFENQPKDLDIHIYLLESDLTQKDKEYLSDVVVSNGGSIHFIKIDKSIFPARCPVSDMWSLETYYRLALLNVLPKDVDRLLYLDVDIIVNQSLEDLYFEDFEGKMVCACPDLSAEVLPDIRADVFREYLEKGMVYFNAGIMLYNINQMRTNYDVNVYLKIAEKLEYKLVAPDQDLLNYAHWNEVKLLDAYKYDLFARLAYNYDIHYEEVKEQVAIVHFAGEKPWQGNCVHYDVEQLWWDYAKKTPFYVEFMEEFLDKVINDSRIYDAMEALAEEKNLLKEELEKVTNLCQKLLQMVQGQ